VPATTEAPAPPRRGLLGGAGRRAVLGVLAVAAFLTIGLPRWLQHDTRPVVSGSAATFAKVCRSHGGTLAVAAGQQRCTVTYGGEKYLMDAVTPNGFDEDTAGFQRQGCDQARRDEPAGSSRVFVFHPDTGVCEHRP